jgi:hypothetical protein
MQGSHSRRVAALVGHILPEIWLTGCRQEEEKAVLSFVCKSVRVVRRKQREQRKMVAGPVEEII